MGRFCYLSAHNHRDVRGTSAQTEWLERAIYLSHNFTLIGSKERMVDLEAFSNPFHSHFKIAYKAITELSSKGS